MKQMMPTRKIQPGAFAKSTIKPLTFQGTDLKNHATVSPLVMYIGACIFKKKAAPQDFLLYKSCCYTSCSLSQVETVGTDEEVSLNKSNWIGETWAVILLGWWQSASLLYNRDLERTLQNHQPQKWDQDSGSAKPPKTNRRNLKLQENLKLEIIQETDQEHLTLS